MMQVGGRGAKGPCKNYVRGVVDRSLGGHDRIDLIVANDDINVTEGFWRNRQGPRDQVAVGDGQWCCHVKMGV
jgi:hypothetical protein